MNLAREFVVGGVSRGCGGPPDGGQGMLPIRKWNHGIGEAKRRKGIEERMG